MNGWVPVASRLPPVGDRVLACVSEDGFPLPMRVLLFNQDDDGQHWIGVDGRDVTDYRFYGEDVTHWMPLPDLPGEEAPDYCHALSPRTRTGCTLLRGHSLQGTQHEAHAGSPDGPLIEAWPLGTSL